MPELKDEIVNKSFFQFLNRGYKGCSLKDLEDITGLTKGAFYYYFRNKEDILITGIEKYLSVNDELSDSELLQIASLKEYIDRVLFCKEQKIKKLQELFDFFIMEVCFFQLILEIAPLFPEYRNYIDELSQKRLAHWEYMLAKAQCSGEIKADLDVSVLAHNFMSVSSSMLNIDLGSENMHFVFSDMRMQFEQYYLLIKDDSYQATDHGGSLSPLSEKWF